MPRIILGGSIKPPVPAFTAPAKGRYVVRIHDLYAAGGDDNHYRLGVSTAPQIDFVFPPVARLAESVKVDVYGVGLPGGTPAALPALSAQEGPSGREKISIDVRAGDPARGAVARNAWRLLAPRDATADLVDLFGDVPGAAQPLAPALLAPSAPVIEAEPNDRPAAAQTVSFPATLAGRFHPRGDRDWFTFEAKAGDTFVFDLVSNRLGLQTDPCLTIESVTTGPDGNPVGKEIAFVDDGPAEFVGGAIDRPSADPTIEFKAPADGTYRILVRDLKADSRTSPENAWVLVARKPAPDFRVLALLAEQNRADANKANVVPPVVDIGGATTIDVMVFRTDGFSGDVTVEAEGLPAGVSAAPAIAPARTNRATLVLSAAEGMKPWSGTIQVVGRAKIGEADVVHTARVATLRFNADSQNVPRIVHELHDVALAVTGDAAPLTVAPTETKVWETARGGKVSIPLSLVRRPGGKGDVSLTAPGLPAELKVPEIKLAEAATALASTATPPEAEKSAAALFSAKPVIRLPPTPASTVAVIALPVSVWRDPLSRSPVSDRLPPMLVAMLALSPTVPLCAVSASRLPVALLPCALACVRLALTAIEPAPLTAPVATTPTELLETVAVWPLVAPRLCAIAVATASSPAATTCAAAAMLPVVLASTSLARLTKSPPMALAMLSCTLAAVVVALCGEVLPVCWIASVESTALPGEACPVGSIDRLAWACAVGR